MTRPRITYVWSRVGFGNNWAVRLSVASARHWRGIELLFPTKLDNLMGKLGISIIKLFITMMNDES